MSTAAAQGGVAAAQSEASRRSEVVLQSAAGLRSDVALIDLLDRLLQGGVVIHGEITLAAADIDLVQLDLRVVVAAIDRLLGTQTGLGGRT